ncbi:MAG: hypothetical protein H7276_06490 [Caulobacter sp.]|nr:hypothetical protein [Vitreoscilla sp.]
MPVTTLDAQTARVVIDLHPLVHENSTPRIFPRIAVTGRTADVLALLSTRGASR